MHQFIHYGAYGRVAKKGGRAFECVAGILGEASRMPGASNHIQRPKPPRVVFGVDPIEIYADAMSIAENGVDVMGRRIRPDASILVAGVASYPIARSAVEEDEFEKQICASWESTTVEWLKREHEDRLRSVVVHQDEKYSHLHFFVLPVLRADRTIDWARAHPGLSNKRNSWLHGESARMQDHCYRTAMIRVQDRFYTEVSAVFQHDRFGPSRSRVTRQEAVMRQKIAEERAKIEAERAAAMVEIEQMRKELALERAHYKAKIPLIKERVANTLAIPNRLLSQVHRNLVNSSQLAMEKEMDSLFKTFDTTLGEDGHAPQVGL